MKKIFYLKIMILMVIILCFVCSRGFSSVTTVQTPVLVSCGVYDVNITVQDFISIGGISMVLHFNPSVFEYQSTGITLNSAISSAITNVNSPLAIPGEFRLSFSDYTCINLANDAILFTLHLRVLPGAVSGNTTSLTWNSGECEYSAPDGIYINPSVFVDLLLWTIPEPITIVDAGTYGPVFSDGADISLTGSPSGGVWSGTGVTGNGSYVFNPSVGSQILTYTFTNSNLCEYTDVVTIMVNPSLTPIPVTNIQAPLLVSCGSYDVKITVQDFNNIGGISMAMNFDPLVFEYQPTGITFNPAISSAITNVNSTLAVPGEFRLSFSNYLGLYLANDAVLFTLHFKLLPVAISGNLTSLIWNSGDCEYSEPNGILTYSAVFNDFLLWSIPDLSPIVDAGSYGPVCIDASDVVLNGLPAGGVWSGAGMNGNLFDPSVGTQSLTYTYTNINLCENSDVTDITVNPLPVVPTGTATQTFYSSELKTVADLTATLTGNEIKCYDAAIGGSIYSGTELLITGIYFASQSLNGCESAERKEISVTVIPNPSSPVANPATLISVSGFRANWNVEAIATGYYLDVATDAGFINFVNGYNNLDVSNVTNYPLSGLSGVTNYYYRIRAYHNGGVSGNSNVITVALSSVILTDGLFCSNLQTIYTGSEKIIDSNLVILNVNSTINNAYIGISSNFISTEDVLLYPEPLYGVTGSFNEVTGVLSLSGIASGIQYQEILRSITYYSNSSGSGSKEIQFSIGALAGKFSGAVNMHYYKKIESSNMDWNVANTLANATTLFGLQGYLATITSQDENNLIKSLLNYSNSFIGASDIASEGIWKWVSGPEAGQQFWQGNESGNEFGGMYSKWDHPFEPNNQYSNENYAQIFGINYAFGSWNDVPGSSLLPSFIIEFGDMPGDPEITLQLSGTKTIEFGTPVMALPSIHTNAVTSVNPISATSGGFITSDGNLSVTERGVCWNTSGVPMITDNHTSDGTGKGYFSSLINGLTNNNTYYVRAYAKNLLGTAYGTQLSFMTQLCIPPVTENIEHCTYMWLSNVTSTGGITNFTSSTDCSPVSYSDYSSTSSVSQIQNGTVNLSFTSFGYPMNYAVWIDFNDDGSFSSEEKVITVDNSTAGSMTVNADFTIPFNASFGQHRMRVKSEYFEDYLPNDPCSENNYGETEDYTMTVIDNTPPPANPTHGGTITDNQIICSGNIPVEITSTLLPTGHTGILEYKWQSSTTSDIAGFSDISSATESSYQPELLSVTNWYKRLGRVESMNDWSGAAESNIICITVNPVSNGGNLSGSASVIYGSSTGNLTLDNYTGIVQRWERKYNTGSWTTILNSNVSYIETPTNTGDFYYRAIVKSGVCDEVNSSEFNLKVNKATLTVTANDKTKTYGDSEPLLDYTPSGNLYFSDNYSVISGVDLNTVTIAAATYGTHTISASGGSSDNYEIVHETGTLTVNKATLTVINTLTQNKIYNADVNADINNSQLSGVFYGGNVQLENSANGTFAQSDAGTNIGISTDMTLSGTDAFNYILNQPTGLKADITRKPLSIIADNKTKTYDGLIFSPFTVTYDGLVSGETSSVLGGILSFNGNAATAVNSGNYNIISGGKISNNYDITFQNGTLIINKASGIVVSNNSDAGYGSLRNAVNNLTDYGIVTFVSGIDGQNIILTTGTLAVDKNVILDNSNHTMGITISGNGDNITINTGKSIALASGSKITVLGTVKNNAGNTGLVIDSESSFIHNTQNLQATVKRYLNNGWHLFGSPFKQSTGAILSNITPAGGSIQMKPYANGINWGNNVTSAYTYLLPTIGYAVKPSVSFTSSLKGNLFYGPFDNIISLIYNGASSGQSWNLLANPFTSYINWNLLTKSNINATLYIWDNILNPVFSPVTNTAYFRTYNATTNIGVPANTTRYIAPLQGFFVKAIYTNPKLTFNLSARTHIASSFYKEASNTEILVRLKTENETGSDELVICKNPGANSGLEEFDSEKLFDGLPLEIYSNSSTGEKLIINTINNTNTIIPLGINGKAGDNAKITAFALETGEQVYLEDRFKGKMMSLTENTSYEFEFSTDAIPNRFFIHFGNINASLTNSDIKIFENNYHLNIIAQTGEILEEIEVFTLTGARIYKSEPGNSNMFTVKLDLTSGIYLIRVKSSISTQNVKISWK